MAQEPVVISNESGASRPGQAADVARYSDVLRITIGTLYIVGGFVGAGMCIVVPVVHLISTWALPLFGILMGVRAFKRRVVIYQPAGVCPTCGQAIELVGGSVDDPSWQTCPRCKAVLNVRAGDAGAVESQPSGAIEAVPSAAADVV